jgi:hypothetical protein
MGLLNLLTDPKNFKFYNGGQGYTGDGSVPNLKNIPYGKDRIYQGSSNQPYIQTPIPDGTNTLGILNNDFVWRAGIEAPINSEQDVIRLSKMFSDTKTPNGLFFTIKQNLLSLTAVRTEASTNILNEGVYNPLNTLAQAGILFVGGHLNKQGSPYSRRTYSEAVITNNQPYKLQTRTETQTVYSNSNYNEVFELGYSEPTLTTTFVTTQIRGQSNRLLNLWDKFIDVKNDSPTLFSYTGGPGAPKGVGVTNIKISSQRTGINNPEYTDETSPSSYFLGTQKKIITPGSYLINNSIRGASGQYFTLAGKLLTGPTVLSAGNSISIGDNNRNVYKPTTGDNRWPSNTALINAQNTYTYTQQDIIDTPSTYKEYGFSPQTQDFRRVLRYKKVPQEGKIVRANAVYAGQIPQAPNYSSSRIEERVGLGDPGARAGKNYGNYSQGVRDYITDKNYYGIWTVSNDDNPDDISYTGSAGLDRLNSGPVYYRPAVSTKERWYNDLVKFRIAVIDNNNPSRKTFIHFRAFLGSISDSYSATWDPVKYLGRGENFYTYGGFTRQISLSWTVAAQSKEELVPMYKRLNWLASSLTPDYSSNGYMRGNLAQLTIGGYLYEVPGIITNLSYEMDDNTPWEIGIDAFGNISDDSTVKELAHIIKVTSFTFIPIHTFRPETAPPGRMNNHQQYISLANGTDVTNNLYGMLPYLSPGELYDQQ